MSAAGLAITQYLGVSAGVYGNGEGRLEKGVYKDRKRLMAGLCKKAGVKYLRFHALTFLLQQKEA
jgi:hypothetical protein